MLGADTKLPLARGDEHVFEGVSLRSASLARMKASTGVLAKARSWAVVKAGIAGCARLTNAQ